MRVVTLYLELDFGIHCGASDNAFTLVFCPFNPYYFLFEFIFFQIRYQRLTISFRLDYICVLWPILNDSTLCDIRHSQQFQTT